jgi:hypothetical protein
VVLGIVKTNDSGNRSMIDLNANSNPGGVFQGFGAAGGLGGGFTPGGGMMVPGGQHSQQMGQYSQFVGGMGMAGAAGAGSSWFARNRAPAASAAGGYGAPYGAGYGMQ